jgi:hypothetical protein
MSEKHTINDYHIVSMDHGRTVMQRGLTTIGDLTASPEVAAGVVDILVEARQVAAERDAMLAVCRLMAHNYCPTEYQLANMRTLARDAVDKAESRAALAGGDK